MRLVCTAFSLMFVSIGLAQETKPAQQPGIIVTAPLAIVPGAPVKVVLRGQRLNELTEVKLVGFDQKVEIVSKGTAAVPQNYDAKKVGDTVAEIKFALPADTRPGTLQLVATSANGAGPAYELIVAKADELIEENEPNDGFKSAQSIEIGKTVAGTIQDPRNVDVFEFKAEAGAKLQVTVKASQAGSLLDPVLTLYDAAGQVIAASDDADGRDPRLEVTVSKPGSHFLSVQDANDSGGQHFVYLLRVSR